MITTYIHTSFPRRRESREKEGNSTTPTIILTVKGEDIMAFPDGHELALKA
jgi:hypothetical protein